ncbi:hypothetical protein CALCODRAFT_367353 [Calocera cornea HHB12733]|uniref:CSN8/PSMD8/EIF3K domain-containing protein n=1 Tax=Calocera cornea HHB12733 TaxID=1353952 RepID=A0A165JAE9_9BASI|nr:hypothetical protein CALCODRAFT_367353 [Calocera cornea HHB12733]
MSAPPPTLPPTPPMPIDEVPSLPDPVPPVPEFLHAESTSAGPAVALAAIGGDHTRPSPYRQVFPDLLQAYERGRYNDVVRLAEEAEVVFPAMKERPTRLLVTIPLVLSYLSIDDLAAAHWALVRLPRVLHTFGPTRALEELLSTIAHRDHAQVYAATKNLISVTTGSLKGEDELDLAIKPLVESFLQTYRTRLIAILSRAYPSILAADAAAYLGMSPEEAVSTCKSMGWIYDEAMVSLRPAPAAQEPPSSVTVPTAFHSSLAPSTLMDFVGIANGASRLESAI